MNRSTAKRENGISNVILPELEFFKVMRFFKDPWGPICNAAANQPIGQNLLDLGDSTGVRLCVKKEPPSALFSVQNCNKGLLISCWTKRFAQESTAASHLTATSLIVLMVIS